MKTLKLCFFVPYYEYLLGGAEYQSLIIAEGLKSLGHEIFFISINDSNLGVTVDNGFKIYSLKTTSSRWNKISLYKNIADQVKEILLRECPDAVYQRILNSFTYRLSEILKQKKIPFLLHIADNYSLDFNKKWQGYVKKVLFKKVLQTRPTIIYQNEFQQSMLEELNYKKIIRLRNLHPQIETEKNIGDGRSLVWIGNARPVKQLEIFLELADFYKGTELRFTVIGGIPSSSYGIALKQKMNSTINVKYLGQQNNQFINEYLLKKTDYLVNTSDSEGFSNTFIQAWLTGTPVISLNSDPENLLIGQNLGYFCNGSIDSLKEILSELPREGLYSNMSYEIRDFANLNFSIENNINKYISVFYKLVDEA